MDYLQGDRAGSASVAALSQKIRNDLGKAMLQLFFVEVFELGLMQSDPNFGNYLIGNRGRRLSLLDFGSVLELEPAMRRALMDTIVAGHGADEGALMDALVRLGCLRQDSDVYAKETFKVFINHLLEPLRHPGDLPPEFLNKRGEYQWAKSGLISRTGKKVAGSVTSRHFTMPTGDFALIARKLTGVFTFIAVLEAEFNAWELIQPFMHRYRD
jgi:predicted unusual protein kinase regulating ubiquinone biosynthesis (AarF/ABC1/UbiB family)